MDFTIDSQVYIYAPLRTYQKLFLWMAAMLKCTPVCSHPTSAADEIFIRNSRYLAALSLSKSKDLEIARSREILSG